MSGRLIYLFLIVRPGEAEALERLMEELKELDEQRGGDDAHDSEPSCN